MFFLGISAHLFIYLLVPAFLVVCFYFGGMRGTPEAIHFVPEKVIYEHRVRTYSQDTCFYETFRKRQAIQKKVFFIFPDPPQLISAAPGFAAITSYFPLGNVLRAPPFC